VAPQTTPVAPFDLVVFGGTGDLAFRKLLPALFLRDRDGQIPPEARIIGAARVAMTDDTYRDAVAAALLAHLPPEACDKDQVAAFVGRVSFITLDATSNAGWQDLAWVLAPASDRIRIFYLAVAPSLIEPICRRLGKEELVTPLTRAVIEKPIGHDLQSAIAIGDAVAAVFDERQIFRIDHYLGKGMVQNLMTLRFANALFEPLWNAGHIDHVEITVAETIGVEQRAGYYDATGALRDVVQNHVLQLLCLIAMEPPAAIGADAVRDEKIKVLRSLTPADVDDVERAVIRGQYRAGSDEGRPVPAYEVEVGHQTVTETFVALKAEIANWRWAGVPFYLRAGKRLKARVSEIVVVFRPIPHSLFAADAGPVTPNRLVLRVQPDEAVDLWVMVKDPGPGAMRLRAVPLDMTFAKTFGGKVPDAYERLLMDVVRGDQTLFMRRDEVEAAWEWIDRIEAALAASGKPPQPYAAGTWGPKTATELLARGGRQWHDPTIA
jgi:glucose-6-phosphate 1-dehydrogenase